MRGGAHPPGHCAEAVAVGRDDDGAGVRERHGGGLLPAPAHDHRGGEKVVEQRLHVGATGAHVVTDPLAEQRQRLSGRRRRPAERQHGAGGAFVLQDREGRAGRVR